MARSPQAWTEDKIEKRLADGVGQGIGPDYKPWLTVGRATPSRGTSNRSGGRTTGRVHHFLSDIERNAFLIYDWACVDAPCLASMIFGLSAGSSIGRVSGL